MGEAGTQSAEELLAAIDLGTSHVRLGILERGLGHGQAGAGASLSVLGDHPTVVEHDAGGGARCSFAACWAAVEELLGRLGRWCREHGVQRVRLAVTGQVSSLIRWADGEAQPLEDSFPIWMDGTCRPALPDLVRLWEGDGARTILGTCMPAATNWLAVKIRHDRHPDKSAARTGRPLPARFAYLQLQDAVVLRLTGIAMSHPSSQISLVDHRSLGYAPEMLRFLALDPGQLPALRPDGQAPLLAAWAARWGLPRTAVHVAPQDTHAALFGMCPAPGDGLLLAGTSEIVGVSEAQARAEPPTRMVRAQLGSSWMIYGSSSSGGSTVDWLMRSVLRRTSAAELEALSSAAEAVPPGCDGLICLPYLAGERAPLWDASLSASLLGLRAHHTDAHLLRAVLEGVAFARRQGAEALECALPARFLAAGGGTKSALWNAIRASVFERPLAVMTTPDLALVGAMRWACLAAGGDDRPLRALLEVRMVEPRPAWVGAYRDAYARFLAAQQQMQQMQLTQLTQLQTQDAGRERPVLEVRHA